jgi:peptidoglycan-N-acetylglucosamine deacetylase
MTDPMRKSDVVRRAALAGVGVAACAAALARRGNTTAATIVAGAGAAIGWATFAPSAPLFGRVIHRGPAGSRQVAVTFDDGPGPSTMAVLDVLARRGVTATFFVLGRQVERYPEVIARMHADGHQIASHGFDHGILVFRGPRHVADQLRRTERAVAAAAGDAALSKLFRTPHGFRGPWVSPTAHRLGYRLAGWTRGVFDSAEPGVETIVRRSTRALAPGAILLLHDADGWDASRSRPQTVAALEGICDHLAASGITAVTIDALVAE